MSCDEIADTFEEWNRGPLDSYLMEISVEVLRHKADDDTPIVDIILDKAGQKGTGLWTAVSSLEEGWSCAYHFTSSIRAFNFFI